MTSISDKPYVMMVTTGEVGRFNRAQRACYNTDESMSVFLTGLLLGAFMFGPFATLLAVVNLYGRCRFADLYTHSVKARGAGFLPSVVSEHVSAALVGICAIKSIGFAVLPF